MRLHPLVAMEIELVTKILLQSIFDRLIRHGRLQITWPDGTESVFTGSAGASAHFRLTDWAAARRLAANPGLAFGESYMDGTLQPVNGPIFDVLDILLTNIQTGATHPILRLHQQMRALMRWRRERNNVASAHRNVAHHYDLNLDFYRKFLDEDLQYSCALFPRGDETLDAAQRAKKRLIANKLHLNRPGLTVLDIGCGWGGLALTLAQEYGAQVIGITLSTEQLAVARHRADQAGLTDRVRFERADYRQMGQVFDRVVSVGMMEHVGVANFDAFFRTIRACLTDEGIALIHHIARSDGPGTTAAWLQKYIFPGGYSPALSEVLPSVERSGLILTDLETLRLHYAQTLCHWRARYARTRDEIAEMYDERFCRMFEFYLAGAELAFRRERQVVVQMQLSPSQESLPATRDYMLDAGCRTAPERQLIDA
jgi:cyclopropane-fatty-acyl-phospholipid synthase